MRKTKIICTIGPKSESKEVLKQLIDVGMDVARMNFSHGDHEEHLNKIKNIRAISPKVSILLDTKGPEIRTLKTITGDDILLKENSTVTVSYSETEKVTESQIYVTYDKIVSDLEKDNIILLDDGLVELIVTENKGTHLVCKVMNNGYLGSKKGVNLPGVKVSFPSITEKDKNDILFAIKHNLDFIAISFVRCANDVLEVRSILEKHNSPIKLISKIEDTQAIKNIEEIIDVSDGIMVARGDLGVEIDAETVPFWQKKIIAMSRLKGIPVITATQMLESMVGNPRPTRAEVNDVTNAILDGTSAIMLSGETAKGKYPVEAVITMDKIAKHAEQNIDDFGYYLDFPVVEDITHNIPMVACDLAESVNASTIICLTKTGFTAKQISKFSPKMQIYALTPDETVARQLRMVRGVRTYVRPWLDNLKDLVIESVEYLKNKSKISDEDNVVVIGGALTSNKHSVNSVAVYKVSEILSLN